MDTSHTPGSEPTMPGRRLSDAVTGPTHDPVTTPLSVPIESEPAPGGGGGGGVDRWPLFVIGGLLALGAGVFMLNGVASDQDQERAAVQAAASSSASSPEMIGPSTEAQREAGWNPPTADPTSDLLAPSVSPSSSGSTSTTGSASPSPSTVSPSAPAVSGSPSAITSPSAPVTPSASVPASAPVTSGVSTGPAVPTPDPTLPTYAAPELTNPNDDVTSLANFPDPPQRVGATTLANTTGTTLTYEGGDQQVFAQWRHGMTEQDVAAMTGPDAEQLAAWTCGNAQPTASDKNFCVADAFGGKMVVSGEASFEDLSTWGHLLLSMWR